MEPDGSGDHHGVQVRAIEHFVVIGHPLDLRVEVLHMAQT